MTSINDSTLGLSIRALNCCRNHGIETIEDLKCFHEVHGDFHMMHNCGRKTAKELISVLENFYLSLDEIPVLDWDNIFATLSKEKQQLIQNAFDVSMLDEDNPAIVAYAKCLELTPKKTLHLINMLYQSVSTLRNLEPWLRTPLLTFKHEVDNILSTSDCASFLFTNAPEQYTLFEMCGPFAPSEHDFIQKFYEHHNRLPLFRLIVNFLNNQTDRNYTFLKEYIGLNSAPKSLQVIADGANLTRERIRQLVVRQKKRLRNKFKYYVDPLYGETTTSVKQCYDVVMAEEFPDTPSLAYTTFDELCEGLRLFEHRPHHHVETIPAPPIEEPSISKVVVSTDTHKPSLSKWPGYCRLMITTPDGEIIETGNSNITFLQFIKEVGWERVRDLGITFEDASIFTDECKNGWYKEICQGTFLCTKMNCTTKIEIINDICSRLNLNYSAKMTEPLNSKEDEHMND